jgi:NTP pyrophosphatase (non-canonical NTP hydrolase)
MHLEHAIIEWGKSRGLMGSGTTQEKRLAKLTEEVGELCREVLHNNPSSAALEIGDCYVVLCQIAYKLGFDMDKCADMAYSKIVDRRGRLVDGTFVKD